MANSATENDYGLGKKKLGVYSLGIALSLLFTIIAFGLVMYPMFSVKTTYCTIFICATLQFIVQVRCFLNMNTKTPQAQYNVMSFIFSIVILAVVVGGSMWIMYHLNINMM